MTTKSTHLKVYNSIRTTEKRDLENFFEKQFLILTGYVGICRHNGDEEQRKEAIPMKKNVIPEERRVVTIGRPSVEHLSKEEQKAFFSALLVLITEYYQRQKSVDNSDKNIS